MHIRKNVLLLSARELKLVREGFEGMMSYPFDDKRSFLYWAGRHGYPDFTCPHHLPDFLTWHRGYVRAFELAMQDVLGNYDIGLPYWDWTAAVTVADGIPKVFADSRYASGATQKDNPLHKSRVLFPPNVDVITTRGGGTNRQVLDQVQRQARSADEATSYLTFQRRLESAHDGLHGWVGGTGGSMSQINVAAFDPIFWFHHANVDRLWARWQDANQGVPVPPEVLTSSLNGLSLDGRDVIDRRRLDYDYAASASAEAVGEEIDALQGTEPVRRRFTIPSPDFRAAHLVFSATEHPRVTVEVRVFLDGEASAETAINDNPACAAVRFVFGHGECMGADEGHCDWRKPRPVLDPRGVHHLTPYDLSVDITDGLKAATARRKRVNVSVVLVDMAGDALPADALRFGELELVTRE